ncbi:MAG: metal-sensitive transcriptional regulator [Planctomycetota bacterium]
MKNSSDNKNKLIALRRIEGQVRGVQRMIESRKPTLDILIQISAIKGALNRVEDGLLRNHLQGILTKGAGQTSEKKILQDMNEILKVISLARKGQSF